MTRYCADIPNAEEVHGDGGSQRLSRLPSHESSPTFASSHPSSFYSAVHVHANSSQATLGNERANDVVEGEGKRKFASDSLHLAVVPSDVRRPLVLPEWLRRVATKRSAGKIKHDDATGMTLATVEETEEVVEAVPKVKTPLGCPPLVLVCFYVLVQALTGGLMYAVQPMKQLVVDNETGGVMSMQERETLATNIINAGVSVGVFSALPAGILCDYGGPKTCAIVGHGSIILGSWLMFFCKSPAAWYTGSVLFGTSTPCIFVSHTSAGLLYPSKTTTIMALLGAGFDFSLFVPMIIQKVAAAIGSVKTVVAVYMALVGIVLVAEALLVPWRRFGSKSRQVEAPLDASAGPSTACPESSCPTSSNSNFPIPPSSSPSVTVTTHRSRNHPTGDRRSPPPSSFGVFSPARTPPMNDGEESEKLEEVDLTSSAEDFERRHRLQALRLASETERDHSATEAEGVLVDASSVERKKGATAPYAELSLWSQLATPTYWIFGILFCSLYFRRLHYSQTIQQTLRQVSARSAPDNLPKESQVAKYVDLYNIMGPFTFIPCLVCGWLVDKWGINFVAWLLAVLGVMLTAAAAAPTMALQVVAIVIYLPYAGYLVGLLYAFLAYYYGFRTLGTLQGVQMALAGLVCLAFPLWNELVIVDAFESNYLKASMIMTILGAATLLTTVYLSLFPPGGVGVRQRVEKILEPWKARMSRKSMAPTSEV